MGKCINRGPANISAATYMLLEALLSGNGTQLSSSLQARTKSRMYERHTVSESTRFVSRARQPSYHHLQYAIPASTSICCITDPARCTGIRRSCHQATAVRPMAAHLEDVSTDVLIREIQRRIECTTKPEKHVVLIGELRMILLLRSCIDYTDQKRDLYALKSDNPFRRPTRLWQGHTVAKIKA